LEQPEGSAARQLADFYLYNQQAPDVQAHYTWAQQQVNRGARPEDVMRHHLTKEEGFMPVPQGWTPEAATQTTTVPQVGWEELPSYMQTDWRQPFSEQEMGAMTQLSNIGLQDAAGREAASRASLAAQRGVPLSSEQAKLTPGFSRWYEEAGARERANLELAKIARGDQLRGEQSGYATNVYNQLMGFPTVQTSTTSPWMGVLQNQAGQYGQQAQQYGQMAGQTMGNIGTILGYAQAYNNAFGGGAKNTGQMALAGASGLSGAGNFYGFSPLEQNRLSLTGTTQAPFQLGR